MMWFNINIKTDGIDWSDWIATVPEKTRRQVEKDLPPVRRQTKKVVQSHAPSNTGIYKKSFIINNFAESKWKVGFQVYAKKPHYRLTHLLENGHRIKLFRRGSGTPTFRGNIGMNFVKTKLRPSGNTKDFKHIEPGQEYAEKQVPKLYQDAYTKSLKERMKKK